MLWLKTRPIFFVREGTKEADVQRGDRGLVWEGGDSPAWLGPPIAGLAPRRG